MRKKEAHTRRRSTPHLHGGDADPNFRSDAEFTVLSGENSPSPGQLLSKYHALGVHMEDDPFIDSGVTWAGDLWQQLEHRVDCEAGRQIGLLSSLSLRAALTAAGVSIVR